MHTVRNRKGARSGQRVPAKAPVSSAVPPTAGPPAVSPPAAKAASKRAKADFTRPFLLAQAATPAFPSDLILPPRRGAIITTAAWPAGMIPPALPATPPLRAPFIAPRGPATIPQGQPDRDRPGHDSRRQEPPRKAPHRDLPPRPGTRTARKAQRRAMITAEHARRSAAATPEVAAACAPPAEMPAAQPLLQPSPPGVHWVAPDDRSPLPRHRAPAVPRPGLLDAMAASLGDAGRFLARLLPGSRRSRELRERVARTEARLRAMEAQLAALEALRARVQV
ncbi:MULTISPECIES: hypothetical protein [unclassified Novosphingobium]|uniref:hypothetical protein n=1 Tax=unclassified Novosphingobium TaxID=2644732 RepID=UPI000D32302F|nr:MULTISPECIES: hypothetical protein [unclassified Novosphingobium]PTR09795.1 hypothetical protein C8K11_10887 [Novosphingobium sp. GV055]PUB02582.1 hypothetical protein C8K12_10887 [Novosphingobium sp. GV061]PUB19527.1 hypothetical protein C8K14_10887 [Novosphingobium sp. GV079]PUB40951.1 hypothetical protein C8K10_10887 [Novosphingobium sp. GV027]